MTSAGAVPPSPHDKLAFRHDINALRAIAVASVVLYHFHLPYAWGGFVGVDVFFVISGFLMTQIVTKRQAKGDFKVWTFYADRFYRIVPALWAVCLAVLIGTAIWLDPLSLRGVARSVASSITFLSNFDYAAQGGYFGGASEANWLLHTWSLSVEWQFYLLYPLLFVIIARWEVLRRHKVAVLVVIALLSLLLCAAVPLTRYDALLRTSFFLLPARAWELIAGGLVALAPCHRLSPRIKTAALVAGLALILASVLTFNAGTAWPSLATVIPVAGAALVIAAGHGSARWTRLPGVQPLGRWSYSIYLWHWPVIAAFTYFAVENTALSIVAGVVLSIAMGWASYVLIEQKLTRRLFDRRTPSARPAVILNAAIGVLLVLTAGVYATRGLEALKFPKSEPTVVAAADRIKVAARDWTFPKSCATYHVTRTGLRICRQGGGGPVETFVIGDSYSEEISPRYRTLPRGATDPAVVFVTRPGCAPLPGVQLRGSIKNCGASTDEALAMAKAGDYPRVAIVASWLGSFNKAEGEPTRGRVCFERGLTCRASGDEAVYLRDATESFARLNRVIHDLRAKGAEVMVTKTFPQASEADPKRLLARLYRTRTLEDFGVPTDQMRRTAAYPNQLVDRLGGPGGAVLVDPLDHLCDVDCPLVVDGTPLYYDVSHIRTGAVSGPAFAFLDPYILPRGAKR